MDLLADRQALLEAVDADLDPDEDERDAIDERDDHQDADNVDLDRGSFPTADSDHGDAWRLAVQTARTLGFDPSEIHQYDTGLFGEPLPCQDDHDNCVYSRAWQRIADPDRPIDLLIGGRGHAYVESARTWYGRDERGNTVTRPRTVVTDEFPGLEYGRQYGEHWRDYATWLVGSLTADVKDFQDLTDADLHEDTWVTKWLAGEGDDLVDVEAVVARLTGAARVLDALKTAADRQADLDALLSDVDALEPLAGALDALTDLPADLPADRLADVRTRIEDALTTAERASDDAYAGRTTARHLGADPAEVYGVVDDAETVRDALTRALTDVVDVMRPAPPHPGGDRDARRTLPGRDRPAGRGST